MAVVSTWTSEDQRRRDCIAADPAVTSLIVTPDPGRPPDTNGQVVDNRHRQNLSTWKGLEELERRGATGLVAKIRTDQTIPIALVRRFAEDFLSGQDTKAFDTTVFITSAFWRSLYQIADFVFVGTLPAVKRFFEAQIRFAAFHSGTGSVHGDIVRKHLYSTVGPALGLPTWRCFPTMPSNLWKLTARPRINAGVIGPWVSTLLDFLVPMPRDFFMKMTWRGSSPLADWWHKGRESGGRDGLFFDDRDLLMREREDLFLREWPRVFGTRGFGLLCRPLDYALEVPHEMKRGASSSRTVLARRGRRLINRARFQYSKS